MASTIQLKTGTGSAVPSSLTQGEVAINIDNGLFYYGSGSVNSVKQLESFTNITASGGISASGDLYAGDKLYINNKEALEDTGTILGINEEGQFTGGVQINRSNNPLPTTLYGNVTASGEISASGDIYAEDIYLENNLVIRYSTANSGLYVAGGIQTLGNSSIGNSNNDTHTFIGHITASTYNISASRIIASTFEALGNIDASGNILTDGSVTALSTGSFARLEATSNVALQVTNSQQIIFENSLGTEFGQIQMNSSDNMLFQNLRSNKDVIIRAGNSGNEGHFIIQPGGDTSTNIAKFGKTADLDLLGNFTASGAISASGNIMTEDLQVDTITNLTAGTGIVLDSAGFIGLDSAGGDIRFRVDGVNQLHLDMDGTAGAQVISPSVAGDDIIFKNQGGDSVLTLKSEGQTEIHGNITASGNISASGQVYDNTYYTWEASARIDSDDDTDWQGPNSKGLIPNEDWNLDFNTDYDDQTSTYAASRLYMNSGWWFPPNSNFSASLKSMDILVQPNANAPTGHSGGAYAADTGFSCSLWYSKNSDVVGEYNNLGSNSGTFIQRHAATVDSGQFKDHTSDKLFKYNNYLVTQSINIDLAPGAWIYPRFKNFGTSQNFTANIYWVIHYCKKPI